MLPARDSFLIAHQREMSDLAQRFASYPTNITKSSIESYLCQFEPQDMQVGLKMLQNTIYHDPTSMINLTRKLKEAVYSINNDSFDNVLFCPMSNSSGNSADMMKRFLRQLTPQNSSMKLYERHFLNNVTDLNRPSIRESTEHKKIVFIDHFIGSGDSILYPWGTIQHWQNTNHEYYVGVLVGYSDAIKLVEETTFSRLKVIATVELSDSNRAFHATNRVFTDSEKETLKKYCERLGLHEDDQYGYKNGQSLVVFSNRISDNVLPILHHTTDAWTPLFPRFM